jgi:hypothetical protein
MRFMSEFRKEENGWGNGDILGPGSGNHYLGALLAK